MCKYSKNVWILRKKSTINNTVLIRKHQNLVISLIFDTKGIEWQHSPASPQLYKWTLCQHFRPFYSVDFLILLSFSIFIYRLSFIHRANFRPLDSWVWNSPLSGLLVSYKMFSIRGFSLEYF